MTLPIFNYVTPSSTMPYDEEYRLNGCLSAAALEIVVDKAQTLDGMTDSLCPLLEEAKCQYPMEDFLTSPIERLYDLADRLEGENKEDLENILKELEMINTNTINSAEYGIGEIDKAIARCPE